MAVIKNNKEITEMKRVWSIYCDPLIQKYLRTIDIIEKDRIYCRHGFEHLINTARIAYILNLENNYGISKELIYTAALLHDIGRIAEYTDGTPHNEAGAEIAEKLLSDNGFSETEITAVSEAIFEHRNTENRKITIEDTSVKNTLKKLIHTADKLSRECYLCKVSDSCKWSNDKKNMTIII